MVINVTLRYEDKNPALFVQCGFTYIGLLIFIALMGIGLSATGVVFHQQAQREKEKELLFAGDQFRRAIASYYEHSPGTKRFPQSLEDLLQDSRYPGVQRYLRRVYLDPMLGSKKWELVRAPDGGIIGVQSGSNVEPLKVDNFPSGDEDFRNKGSYAQWAFVYTVPVADQTAAPAQPNQPSAAPSPVLSRSQTPEAPAPGRPAGK